MHFFFLFGLRCISTEREKQNRFIPMPSHDELMPGRMFSDCSRTKYFYTVARTGCTAQQPPRPCFALLASKPWRVQPQTFEFHAAFKPGPGTQAGQLAHNLHYFRRVFIGIMLVLWDKGTTSRYLLGHWCRQHSASACQRLAVSSSCQRTDLVPAVYLPVRPQLSARAHATVGLAINLRSDHMSSPVEAGKSPSSHDHSDLSRVPRPLAPLLHRQCWPPPWGPTIPQTARLGLSLALRQAAPLAIPPTKKGFSPSSASIASHWPI
ncbi:hypothetical protein DFH27DRAFT_177501 [Peziza echinospora]|nr:hypothetical protein DFH27DRAFT_177501 [Peziza echinospora]